MATYSNVLFAVVAGKVGNTAAVSVFTASGVMVLS